MLCKACYPQTKQLMHEVASYYGGVVQHRHAQRQAELVYQVRQVSVDLQQSCQPVLMKMIAKALEISLTKLRSYPAVKTELAHIRANMVSQCQRERQNRETELLN